MSAQPSFAELLAHDLKAGWRSGIIGKHWSVEELAVHLKISARSLRNWRNGSSLPSQHSIAALEAALYGSKNTNRRKALRTAYMTSSMRLRTAAAQSGESDVIEMAAIRECFRLIYRLIGIRSIDEILKVIQEKNDVVLYGDVRRYMHNQPISRDCLIYVTEAVKNILRERLDVTSLDVKAETRQYIASILSA